MSLWGYCSHNGPHTWGDKFPLALGQRQSPININSEAAVADDDLAAQPLQLDYLARAKLITNTGSSWKVTLDGPGSVLQGGPLGGDKYRLEQFHCHWGKGTDEGSEHTVDGASYPAEIHLVHWNCDKYGSMEEAVDKEDGLVVLGIFLQVGEEHAELGKIVDLLSRVEHNGDNFFFEQELDPATFLPENKSYWTYGGSLTTPPCLESVTWIVFKEPVQISEAQLNSFRQLRTYGRLDKQPEDEFEGQIIANFRPPVEVGERTVRSCDLN
ncbi:unnamed protein product [Allacma fusca]|uniref:Carbonic anhydrase n=1 Tax=Allacma fusca TaxID=39272 RepID=A0A8J2PVN9_9HEXA|nr:unnamed protein product [Allacma fusca]